MEAKSWNDLNALLARRSHYPSDMGFLPLSDKFSGEGSVHAPWLAGYFQFRQLYGAASREELLQAMADLGGSASALADRSRGALLGLALGDALGMPLEFSPRDSRHVQGLERGGPFNLEVGQWTDDTSMACCLAYSLIHKAGFDAAHQMECYSYWYRYGAYSPTGACFDIGGATRAALEKYLQTGEACAGSTDPRGRERLPDALGTRSRVFQ